MSIAATETQRDQAITERDDARRRLAEAEARIGRLQDGINAVTATAHAIGHHTGWIEPCISEFLLPGDPDPVAPDDAEGNNEEYIRELTELYADEAAEAEDDCIWVPPLDDADLRPGPVAER